ncbi:putative TPR domain protein [Rosellinia necatrix]|uniref:Putative TPR domain protein n=1 Tax=Rosellinia necatrix TaxID=77044 RepID=A0A1W2TTP9_ROSNE|nr:putative TPR domain protein [Rosellinia necatrix]
METPTGEQIASMLQRCINAAERANLRRGYIPKHHPRPQDVVGLFMNQRRSNQQSQANGESRLMTTQVPPAYAPSVRSIGELTPIAISQMELQKHHRGRKAVVRVITPPDNMNAIMAIVEDEEGTAVLLQLYHQPKLPQADPEDILCPHMVLVIKEPFFKAATDGSYSVRVDHISDVVWLHESDPCIPSKWRNKYPKSETSEVLRKGGNLAVKHKQWTKAEKLYSDAMRTAQTPEEEQLARLNRSFVNLQLGRPEKALFDAASVHATEKSLFRQARALYELGKFVESLEKWRAFTQSYPQNREAKQESQRAAKRIKEVQRGEYDFASMYDQAEATPPIIDCATYQGPLVVRESQGRGNGLFTTRSVKAGELLLCEKAFAYCYAATDDPIGRMNMIVLMQLETKQGRLGGHAHLLTKIIQKLYHSPQASEEFKALYHGDYVPVAVSEADGRPIVDTFFVDRVMNMNCFGAPRTSHGTKIYSKHSEDEEKYTTCGIWLLASRINHACLGNCRRSFIGDMQIVRACQDLPAGTELQFPYRIRGVETTYEEAQKIIGNWGFVCDCLWCLDCKSTTKKTLSTRNSLLKALKVILKVTVKNETVDPKLLTKISGLLSQADKTYPTRPGAVRPELWDGYFTLGFMLISHTRAKDGIEAIIKGFEALGYDIVAYPGGGKKLEIKRWGHAEISSVRAFVYLHEAYKMMAPELCSRAKHYATAVYRICTGTDIGIGIVFPELA